MKNKKIIIGIVVCLLIITAVVAGIHIATRDTVAKGCIIVETEGATQEVSLDKLNTVSVDGSVVNGKGEEKRISGKGILIKDLLTSVTSYDSGDIEVVASDEYHVTINGDEVNEDGKVYLLVENQQGKLIVFGDPNSKRNVSNVARIIINK